MKWNKARSEYRKEYAESLLKIKELKGSIFFEIFSDTKKYIELTSFATAKAILKKTDGEYKVTVFVDGFTRREIEIFSRGLRDLKIRTRKIRGIKKDENDAYIRLVDTVCGIVRDAQGGNEWAEKMVEKFAKKKIVTSL